MVDPHGGRGVRRGRPRRGGGPAAPPQLVAHRGARARGRRCRARSRRSRGTHPARRARCRPARAVRGGLRPRGGDDRTARAARGEPRRRGAAAVRHRGRPAGDARNRRRPRLGGVRRRRRGARRSDRTRRRPSCAPTRMARDHGPHRAARTRGAPRARRGRVPCDTATIAPVARHPRRRVGCRRRRHPLQRTRCSSSWAGARSTKGSTRPTQGSRPPATATPCSRRRSSITREMFADARDQFDVWWGKPVPRDPGAAQQARALSRMSEIGIDLAGAGSRAALAADPGATELTGGTVPLAKIAALETPLTDARVVARGVVRVEPHRCHVARRSDRQQALRAPHEGDALGPRGRDRHPGRTAWSRRCSARTDRPSATSSRSRPPRNNRASGGIIGNYAVISFTDGHLTLEVSGRDGDLNTGGEGNRTLTGPPEYVQRYSQFSPGSPGRT